MNKIKTREMKTAIVFLAAFTAVCCIAGIFLGVWSAALAFVCCAVPTVVFLTYEKKRYSQIEQLTANIDRVLHGGDDESISDSIEGEPYILKSEIRKLLIRLREQNDELKKDKIFLSDSIADISHQLRTPLTSINLVITLLKAPDLTKEKHAQLVSELARLLAKTDDLITVLLKFSKFDAGSVLFEMQKISTKEVVKTAVEPLEIFIELKGQKLITDVEDHMFCGDIHWLCEAIGNILKNCSEHTPSDGVITVTSSQTPIYTQIEITDNGTGIDEEDLPHIFERFYKGKQSSDNSFGIGLALAQTIVKGHGGIIKARNGRDGGAVFTVRFYNTVV